MESEREMILRVLTYHRIAEAEATPHLNPRMISASPRIFARHMQYLDAHYRVVSGAAVLAAVTQNTPLPRDAVLLTFDDAYCDFGEQAWPILKKYRLPATLFVPTGYPDDPARAFWWDRLYRAFKQVRSRTIEAQPLRALACDSETARMQSLKRAQNYVKTLPHAEAMNWVENFCREFDRAPVRSQAVLRWEELRTLAREGVTLGAHTVSHPMMTRLTPEEVRYEIEQAQQDLQREIGAVLPVFCYPSGGHDDLVVRLLRAAGIKVAFTTLDGENNLPMVDPLRLRRTNITPRTTPFIFRLRLTRWAAQIDQWRHRER